MADRAQDARHRKNPSQVFGWRKGVVVGATVLLCSGLIALPKNAVSHGGDPDCKDSEFISTDVGKAIPDNGTVESTITVPTGGAVHDVDVHLDVAHPFDSDLRVELLSPMGRMVSLADSVGMWGNDFIGTVFDDEASTSIVSELPPYTGRFRPSQELRALDRKGRAGTWTLHVTDQRGNYAGSITGWGLEISTCSRYRAPIDRIVHKLPIRCGPVGAPTLPPLPAGVPSGEEGIRGTLITVTTNSDASNGDISSVAGLQASPGPDGISLREVIHATNNEPGQYTVRFAPDLAGTTISEIGPDELPPLTGGGVFVNGDINGDGRPDVTLDLATADPTPFWSHHLFERQPGSRSCRISIPSTVHATAWHPRQRPSPTEKPTLPW